MGKDKLIKISKRVEPILKAIYSPMAIISGKSKNMEKALFHPLIMTFSDKSKCDYIQYIAYPKHIENIRKDDSRNISYSEYAIIIQGQILYDNNFTLNTIRLYRSYYKDAKLIVSTWKGVDDGFKREIKKYSVVLLENEPPENSGSQNVNMQIYSSFMGAKKAKELGCKYVGKTRTDQRFYAFDMLTYLRDMIYVFPIKSSNNNINNRLVFLSFGSYKKLPFFLCDFFAFGEVSDIIQLYSVPHDIRDLEYHKRFVKEEYEFIKKFYRYIEIEENISPYDAFDNFNEKYFRYMFAENFILYHFYDKVIQKIKRKDDLLELYRDFLSKYVIVIDYEPLMMLWIHHGVQTVEQLTVIGESGKLDYKSWLRLYLKNEDISAQGPVE